MLVFENKLKKDIFMQPMNEEAFCKLKKTLELSKKQEAIGRIPRNWLIFVSNNMKSENSLIKESLLRMAEKEVYGGRLTRGNIYQLVSDRTTPTIDCVISILAWGGRDVKNGSTALSTVEDWLPICDEIRSGNLSRANAYEKFKSIRGVDANPKLQGMGPAYYTKLIFFLMPQQIEQGYIMDQWTGASVNLISGIRLVKLNRTINRYKKIEESVSDDNTKDDYENFCKFIEYIAKRLREELQKAVDPATVELAMFSFGGREKGEWRKYVIEKRAAEQQQLKSLSSYS